MADSGFEVPVAIVGGGPVGMMASLLLARQGVASTVVERNPSTSDHPKAHVINTRTMEILRSLGLDEAVKAEAIDPEALRHVRWVHSLTGEQFGHLDRDRTMLDVSPTLAVSCAQDRLEQILLRAAGPLSSVVFDTDLTAMESDERGMTLHLNSADGERTIGARFVIGADGATSTVRDLLGIEMDGPSDIATLAGTYFHGDLEGLAKARPAVLHWVLNTRAPGVFIALDGRRRWMFHSMDPDVTDAKVEARLRTAIGDDSIEIDIKSTRPWRMTAQVAQRFGVGRVFLAGDAAHRFPPTGGLGLNTGVQDVHNLAWKLSRVIDGRSPDSLLDSYELERRPIAETNCRISLDNFAAGGRAVGPGAIETAATIEAGGPERDRALEELRADIDSHRAHFGGLARDIGINYRSGASLAQGSSPGDGGEEYLPSALPGSRAPHVWLTDQAGRQVSTIDLLHDANRFAVISSGDRNPEPTSEPVTSIGVSDGVKVGGGYICTTGRFAATYGLEPGGFVVVRPDGHVAYRSLSGQDTPSIDELIRSATG